MTIRLTFEERQARDAYRKLVRDGRPAREKLDKDPVKLGGPMVEITKRPQITDAQKRASHQAHDGLCWLCGQAVPMFGPEVQYDHKLERWEQGKDTLDNIGPAHTTPCHARKTAQKHAERAHMDRAGKKHRGETRPKGKIPSRGFGDDYQPMGPSRGFSR